MDGRTKVMGSNGVMTLVVGVATVSKFPMF